MENCFQFFLEKNPGLIVANNLPSCEGLITRRRITVKRVEESVLDLFIINSRILPFVSKLVIDEEGKYSLTNFAQFKKNKRAIKSDHWSPFYI